MADTIANFVGTWYVKWATGQRVESGESPYIATGYTLLIGTGTDGAFPPKLTDAYDVTVGFALLDGNGTVVLSSAEVTNQPVQFLYLNNTLRWTGYWTGQPVRIYISLGETVSPSGLHTFSLYASTTYGDPDQVGVWGADGNPPHGGGPG